MKEIEIRFRCNVPDNIKDEEAAAIAQLLIHSQLSEPKEDNVELLTKMGNFNCNPRLNVFVRYGNTFGDAIEALKRGNLVTRAGWNGKGMFLWLKHGTKIKADMCYDPVLKGIAITQKGEVEGLPTICMKTADNKVLTGWLASQSDMLATDWIIIPIDHKQGKES